MAPAPHSSLRRCAARTLLAAAALAVGGLVPAAADAASPLVGEWHLDSKHVVGGNDVVDDTSGSGNHLLTPTGGALIDTSGAKFGGALTTASSASLKSAGPGPAPAKVTLMAWIKQNGDPGVQKYIAGRGDDGPGICFGSSYALYTGYAGKEGLHFYVRRQESPTPPAILTDAPPTAAVFDNQWHLVTGTFDGFDAKLYVDGSLISSVPVNGPIEYSLGGGGTSTFNVDGYSQPACGNTDFPGRIDEVRVYDRALTATEIGRLAAATGPTPPALVPDPTPTPVPSGAPTPTATPIPTPAPLEPAAVKATVAPVPASQTLGGTVSLDASGSQNADEYDWDLGGDGKTDIACPGDQPVVSVSTTTAATKPATVTAVSKQPGVSAATASTGLKLPATLSASSAGVKKSAGARAHRSRLRAGDLAAKSNIPDVAVCSPSTAKFVQGTGGKLLTPEQASICVNQTVIWGLASVKGCFKIVGAAAGVPAPERALIQQHYDSSTYSRTVTAVCTDAAQHKRPQADCDGIKKLYESVAWGGYISTGPVDLNGIRITPDPGKTVVMFPHLNRIVSGGAKVRWGKWTVKEGAVDFNFENDERLSGITFTGERGEKRCACGTQRIGSFSPVGLPSIGGFDLAGLIDLDLYGTGVDGQRQSVGTFNLSLPDLFSVAGGTPRAQARIVASQGVGPQITTLDLQVPDAEIGPLDLSDLRFRFSANGPVDPTDPNDTCQANEWRAQAKIKVGDALLDMAPPPSQNGIAYCNSEFKAVGAHFYLPDPKPQLFPGVQLNDLGFALQLHPFLARGDVGITIVDLIGVNGTVLLTLPTPREPYTLTAQDAGGTLATYAGRKFTSLTFMVGGQVYVEMPVIGRVDLGSAAAFYSYPDRIGARAEAHFGNDIISAQAYISIEAAIGKGKFTSAFGGKACVAGVKGGVCLGADGNVTSKGFVACLNIFDLLHPGAGVNWADGDVEIWPIDGCKPSHYWVYFDRPQLRDGEGHRLAVGDAVAFDVKKGEGVKNVRIDAPAGASAPPKIKVTAPGGEVLTIDGDDWVRSAHMAGVRYDKEHKSVYVGVKDGPVGDYTVEKVGDSVPLGTVAVTRDEDTTVEASVGTQASAGRADATTATAARVGTGTQVLRYDAGSKSGGAKVQFIEQSDGGGFLQDLGTVSGGKGTLRFTPAAGPAGKRKIAAYREVDGIPARAVVVATYTVAPPKPLPAPSKVTVRRKGTSLVVTWAKVAGADRYAVLLKLKGGEQRQLSAKAGQRSLTIKDVPAYRSATARVAAHGGPLEDWGKGRTSATLKAKGLPPTVFQTGARNEKKGNF